MVGEEVWWLSDQSDEHDATRGFPKYVCEWRLLDACLPSILGLECRPFSTPLIRNLATRTPTECNESALEAAARSRKTCALSSASAGRVKPAMQRSHLQHCIMNRLGVSAVTADVTVS